MPNAVPIPAMHGFTAAIGHAPGDLAGLPGGGIAVGVSGNGVERVVALALRHADGTVLVAHLPDSLVGRLGDALDRLNDAAGPYVTVFG